MLKLGRSGDMHKLQARARNTQHTDLIIEGVLTDDGLVGLDAEEWPASDELPEARVSTQSLESQGISAIACKYVQPLPFMHFPSAKNLHMTVGKRGLPRASFPVLALSWPFSSSAQSRRLDPGFGPVRPSSLVSRVKARSVSFMMGASCPVLALICRFSPSAASRRLDPSFGPIRPSNFVSRAKVRSVSFTMGAWLPLVSRRRPA